MVNVYKFIIKFKVLLFITSFTIVDATSPSKKRKELPENEMPLEKNKLIVNEIMQECHFLEPPTNSDSAEFERVHALLDRLNSQCLHNVVNAIKALSIDQNILVFAVIPVIELCKYSWKNNNFKVKQIELGIEQSKTSSSSSNSRNDVPSTNVFSAEFSSEIASKLIEAFGILVMINNLPNMEKFSDNEKEKVFLLLVKIPLSNERKLVFDALEEMFRMINRSCRKWAFPTLFVDHLINLVEKVSAENASESHERKSEL